MTIYRTVLILALSLCVCGNASAQIEFAQLKLSDCDDDIHTHCATVPSGGGRVMQCLLDHQAKITLACKDAVSPSDFPSPKEGVSLTVTIGNIKSNEGFIWLTLADDEKIFPRGRRTIVVPAQVGSVVATFHRLKPGRYAVLSYHDANDNGKMDTNAVGIPIEGGCFSNNVIGFPTFESTAVAVPKDTEIKMTMNYLKLNL